MPVRGVRGATVAEADSAIAIRQATRELLQALVEANRIDPADIASIIFTTTADLSAEPPARTAREMGWNDTAMLCVREMDTGHSPERCIRVLIHWNTDKKVEDIVHVYLHAAVSLRPDRAGYAAAAGLDGH